MSATAAPPPAFGAPSPPSGRGRRGAPADTPALAFAERLQGVAMIVLLAVAFWQGVTPLTTQQARNRLQPTLNFASFLAGRTAGAINSIMAHDLPVDYALRAAGGIVRWELFRSGGPQVSVGCDDWLYLTEELRPWSGAEAAMQTRAEIVRRIAAKLRGQNIGLVVAVVPDKARVQAASSCGLRYAAQARQRYGAFAAMLKPANLPTVDLYAALAEAARHGPVYYRTDTHWNQPGAALSARAIATVADGAATLSHDATFHTDAATAETDRPGDLLRLMSLERLPAWLPLRPRPDRERVEHTTETGAPADTGGLLDEGPAVEAVLLGSSYSRNANFQGRLQEALRTRIVAFARPGGGFAEAAREFFTSIAYRETPPKLVIWEIPERVLGQPIGDDERKLLAGF
jgi:alginate O-acetyltransferase complex protein AlgJ